MTGTFRTRIPTLPQAELLDYVENPWKYKPEAVAAAVDELRRRGMAVEDTAPPRAPRATSTGFFRGPEGPRLDRIRLATGAMLAAGLGMAAAMYRRAAMDPGTGFTLEPEDSKSYLRQLEMFGGRANVVASGLRRGFAGLWEGRNLAFTTALLTLGVALVFWMVSTRRHPGA